MSQTPHRRHDDEPLTGVRALMAKKISVGWALLVTTVVFGSVALIAYSLNRNFDEDSDRIAEDVYFTCVNTNTVRANAASVAGADVDTDRQIWMAIDDLFDDGIPEPARTVIFAGLKAREQKIEATYVASVCPVPPSLVDDLLPPATT